jgi:hypothetical protein
MTALKGNTPPVLADVALAILESEAHSDVSIAAAAKLIEAAATARLQVKAPPLRTQPIFDRLQEAMNAQFDSRRALYLAHASLLKLGKDVAASKDPFGPDGGCPFAPTDVAPRLQSVA